MKKKILFRLLIAIVPVSAFSLILSLLVSFYFMSKTIDSYVPESNIKASEVVALKVSDFMHNAQTSLESVSDIVVQESYASKKNYILKQVLLKKPFFRYLYMVDASGTEIANTNIDGKYRKYEKDELFGTAFQGKVSFSDIYLSGEDIPSIEVCVPCTRWRKVEAVLCGEVDFRTIWDVIDSTKIGKTGYAILTTNDGQFLSHPEKSRVLELESLKNNEVGIISNEKGSYFENNNVLTTFSTVEGTGWKAVVKQDSYEVFKNYILLKKYTLATTVLLVFSVVVLITFFSRQITRPIESLKKATETISTGNLEHRIDVETEDEIGALAKSFNKMVEDLKKQQRMLIQTEKLSTLGSFAASIAHEIQGPISGLLGYVYLLRSKQKEEKVAEFAVDMEEELRNIQSIIERLLSLSKQTDYIFENLNLNNVVERSVQLLEHHFSRFKKIELRKALKDNLPEIRGDKILLQQAFLNILSNAGDAMGETGIIEVSSSNENGRVSVTIKDNGEGIDNRLRDKIFEPFFTSKQERGGTGLGLYVTNEIIKLHNGHIDVSSEKGMGTTFTLTFIA